MMGKTFRAELIDLINRHSKESRSDTPDFILAEYLIECLNAYDKASRRRLAFCKGGVLEARAELKV